METLITTGIIALLSLAITFVLFKKMESTASGEGSIFANHRVRYGGAIAGFLIVYVFLFYGYNSLKPPPIFELSTNHYLNGVWKIDAHPTSDVHTIGKGTIQQDKNNSIFKVRGEFDNLEEGKPKIIFNSIIGQIDGDDFYLIYETSQNERGVCTGKLDTNDPNKFYMDYYDLIGFDKQDNPTGRFYWTRIDE